MSLSGSSNRSSFKLSRPASASDSLVANSTGSAGSEIDDFVEALASNPLSDIETSRPSSTRNESVTQRSPRQASGTFEVTGSNNPIRPVKIDSFDQDFKPAEGMRSPSVSGPPTSSRSRRISHHDSSHIKLRVLIVEDNDINRLILAKRLTLDGHQVVNTTNGQEGLDTVMKDRDFDCILMDIQMPILNGYEATERIREFERSNDSPTPSSQQRLSQRLNGRIPIFAVSASLFEDKRDDLKKIGVDGWILKPIDFKRLTVILRGVTDPAQRQRDLYTAGRTWELGGWLNEGPKPTHSQSASS